MMLGSGSSSQQQPAQEGGKKKRKGRCKKSGKKSKRLDPNVIPDGALEEHRPQFESIWNLYFAQLYKSNNMDLDVYPGASGNISVFPIERPKTPMEEMNEIENLANLAIQKYNKEPSNVFTYQFLKIEKVNRLQTGFLEYFITVKVRNLTLGTVVETFQICAGATVYKCWQVLTGLAVFSEDDVTCCFPKLEGLLDSSEEEMAGSQSSQFSPEKKPNSAEELLDWQRKLPHRFLANEVLWDDNLFIPQGASKEHPTIFRRIYWRYFKQICETEGFDIDIYPGDSEAAMYIPYLDFENEIDLLMDLANHAIQDYNNRETDDYKYEVESVEKVNYILAECREFLMTVKVKNLTLRTPVETFQIHAYKGADADNVVRTCRRKLFELSLN